MLVMIECKNCGKTLPIERWKAKRGQKYCSQRCATEAKRGVAKVPHVQRTCPWCRKTFAVQPSRLKQGRGKFCSRACQAEHQKTITGEKHPRYGAYHSEESKLKISRTRKERVIPRGPAHPRWKGGYKTDSGGYRLVPVEYLSEAEKALAEPMKTKAGYVMEHRLVVARRLGRPLKRNEIVHHKNGTKDDNRDENLEVLATEPHSRLHQDMIREIARLKAENKRLKSLLATYQNPG